MTLARQAWDWLQRELDHWGENDLQAEFWWRDDDAVQASPQLDRLLALGADQALPIALAVIPAALQDSLEAALRHQPSIQVLQHGYAHCSHALPGQRKLELGGSHDRATLRAELEQGHRILQSAFGASFVNVMVPPWNRIDANLHNRLASIGLVGLSTMRVRRTARPAPGLLQVNTHLDPIAWRQQRGFIGDYPAIAILVQHLLAKRTGYRDIAEPTGILSHHLVQSERVWRFLQELFDFLLQHPAVRFVNAQSIWKAAAEEAAAGSESAG